MTDFSVAEEAEAPGEDAGVGAATTRRPSSTWEGSRSSRALGRPSLVALAAAFAAYLLVSVGLWWHVWSTHPTGIATCGCGDAAFVTWFLAWPANALSHGHNLFYSSLLFHPTGVNMLSNVSALAIGVPLVPVTLLFGAVATLNVALTLAPALSALGMFWLLRRWVRWTPAAFVGGLVYGFSPFVLTAVATAHVMLGFLVLLPLIVACVDELLVRQGRRTTLVGAALGLLVTVEFFVSSEMVVIMAISGVVALIMLGAYAMLTDRQELIGRLPHAARGLGVAALVALVLLAYPLWFALAGPAHLSGRVWPTLTAGSGGITPSGLWQLGFSTSDRRLSQLLGGYLGPALPSYEYLGLGLLVVLAVGVVVWWRDRLLWLFGALGAISVLLSLGVENRYWVPWRLLAHVPLVQNILPGRFIAVTTLCAAVMLAVVVDRVRDSAEELLRRLAGSRWGRRGPALTGLLTWLAALGVAAVGTVPLGTAVVGKVPLTVQPIKLPRWFADAAPRLPPGQVVLAYPAPFSGVQAPMAWQAVDSFHFAMVGGGGPAGIPARAGSERPGLEVLSAASLSLSGPPSGTTSNVEAVRRALAGWGVTVVVVPDPSGLPRYDQGTSPETALGLFTAAIGRRPELRDDAWVWSGVQSPGPQLSVSPLAFTRCTSGGLIPGGDRQGVPDCIIAPSAR